MLVPERKRNKGLKSLRFLKLFKVCKNIKVNFINVPRILQMFSRLQLNRM